MTARTTLAIVYVRWSEQPGDAPLSMLTDQIARAGTTSTAVCVVDNRAGLPPVTTNAPRVAIAVGNNSAREFSGYDQGVRCLRAAGSSPDVWLLANDRLDAYGLDALALLSDHSLELAATLPCALGQVDVWPGRVQLLGFDVSPWARSNLLLVPDRALRSVGSLVSIDARQFGALVTESPPEPRAMRQPARAFENLGETWSTLAAEWLTGTGSRLRSHWYKAAPIEPSTWPELRAKAHSIVNEQLLSARLRRNGTPVLPLSLAATMGSLPSTGVRAITSATIRRWPAAAASVARTRGVGRVVRSCASVESSIRAGVRGVLG